MKFKTVMETQEPIKVYNLNSAFEYIDPKFSFGDTTVFCDMDGVLTNMVKHYYDLTGKDLEDRVNNKKWYRDVQGNIEFWENMIWLDDGKELWDYIKQFNPCILTSPCLDSACKKGKIAWVKRDLGDNVPIIVALKKHLVFNQPTLNKKILIDDKEKNTLPWEELGGVSVLHINASDSVSKLKVILEKT